MRHSTIRQLEVFEAIARLKKLHFNIESADYYINRS